MIRILTLFGFIKEVHSLVPYTGILHYLEIIFAGGELTEARISSLQTYVKSINPDEQDVIQWLMNHKAGPITDMMPQSQSQIYTPLTVERVC